MSVILVFLQVLLSFSSSYAFIPSYTPVTIRSRSSFTRPYLSSSGSNNWIFDDTSEVKGGLRYFLTQRAIQSFMFLADQNRDPHTVRWIEEFGEVDNMLLYHGTGAFNHTKYGQWDSFLLDMVREPKGVVTIQAPRRNPFGSGALGQGRRKNPYLQQRYVEYTIEIDPASLVTRIMSVREQIAKELINDLPLIAQAGELIIDSYQENLRRDRDDEDSSSQRQQLDEECEVPSVDEGGENDNETTLPYSVEDECMTEKTRDSTFRQKMLQFSNDNAFNDQSSSPLRRGNFDLVSLLALQESVHRVLREYKKSSNTATFEFLKEFYFDRIESHFDGDGMWSRDEMFLEDLMTSTPKISGSAKNVSIIDPVSICQKIIHTRGDVVMEWKDAALEIPDEHLALRKRVLIVKMDDSKLNADSDDVKSTSDDESSNIDTSVSEEGFQ